MSGGIDRYAADGDRDRGIQHRGPGDIGPSDGTRAPRPTPASVPGTPIDYVAIEFERGDCWNLIGQQSRTWIESNAGPMIQDPHLPPGKTRYYWSSRIHTEKEGGPGGGQVSARHQTWVFGAEGLAAVNGHDPTVRPRRRLPLAGRAVRHPARPERTPEPLRGRRPA